jgi:hypothetical protein
MLMMVGLTVLVAALMQLPPGSAIRVALQRALIEGPARALNRLSRGRIVFFALLTIIGATLALMVGIEGLHLFGLALPDLMIWFAVFDVGVFIDALLIAGALLAARAPGVARTWLAVLPRTVAARVARFAARARRPRRRPVRPKNDSTDGEGRGWRPQPAGYRAFSMA